MLLPHTTIPTGIYGIPWVTTGESSVLYVFDIFAVYIHESHAVSQAQTLYPYNLDIFITPHITLDHELVRRPGTWPRPH
ncbi:uncharacterized protein PgNI_08021 [Pyricularia grisea]|uniref:Uncharacterized protein n=1 Tax=Pyricularia grisea TaxID=148305 RepID=A0A6P8AWF2_PYRGI|nr:uncharacterized protein PgNI_08021 [Pyricularia grisea]TLD06566.1 hypothetical protein PgNI_08021 [Pyricularia grisea]